MKLPRTFLLAIFSLTLAGCASTSTPVTDSRPVSPRHYYRDFPRYEHRVPYDAKVVVVRDRNDHRLSVEPAFHIGPTPVGRTFHFEPNQTSYFRVVTSINSFDLQPTGMTR